MKKIFSDLLNFFRKYIVDIMVILIVFILSISFYVIYYNEHKITDDMIIEIKYKNMVIYQTNLEDDLNINVEITSKDKILNVKIGDNIKTYQIKSDAEIENTVLISSEEIRMVYANCENKYCYNMKIGKTVASPIVCTNGITVKLISNEFVIEV